MITFITLLVFIDGTWLYYSIVEEIRTPIRKKFGNDWYDKYFIDWKKIPQIIASNLKQQLFLQSNILKPIDVVRTSVFTSSRPKTDSLGKRASMFSDLKQCNFDMHHFVTSGHVEKCVDISLAVEMVYMSAIPDAFDIAVIITGDKDFIPALQKVRQRGKRTAICSIRNSCNRYTQCTISMPLYLYVYIFI